MPRTINYNQQPIPIPSTGGVSIYVGGAAYPAHHKGGVKNQINGGSNPLPVYFGLFDLPQICGLIPVWDCDYTDCRLTQADSCWRNPVFGDIQGSPSYSNDRNSFFLDWNPPVFLASSVVVWKIQKAISGVWTDSITITTNAYGQYFPVGSIPHHPTYTGVVIDWGAVFNSKGAGNYRICINGVIQTTTAGQTANGGIGTHSNMSGDVSGGVLSFSCPVSGSAGSGKITGSLTSSSGTISGFIGAFSVSSGIISNVKIPFGTFANGQVTADISGVINGMNFSGNIMFFTGSIPGVGLIDTGKINIIMANIVNTQITACKCSDTFWLRKWNCDQAARTTKFECWNTGQIGDVNADYTVFDLCGFVLYDSVRLKGFIKREKPAYEETMLEFQNGLLDLIRAKNLKYFKFLSEPMPLYLQNRFSVYCLMADTILGSDYNYYNADYFIKRKTFKRKDSFDNTMFNDKFFDRGYQYKARLSEFSVDLREGVESVIKSTCCSNVGLG